MKIRAAQLSFLLCVLAASNYGHPQDPPKHDKKARPTLGLVLEGGGALGLAHIGVITWMEEHRIPVNYVAGTSMGGLVGGANTSLSGTVTASGPIPIAQVPPEYREGLRESHRDGVTDHISFAKIDGRLPLANLSREQ
jgi:hypothetical protein